MPGCIDSFEPELSGWFFVKQTSPEAQSGESPTLLLTLNGQTLLAFQPRLRRPDVDKAHGRSCGAVGFRLPVADLVNHYRLSAQAVGLSLQLQVVCPGHPGEPIENSRHLLTTPARPRSAIERDLGPDRTNCVHFYSINFFDPGGNTVFSGGAERYIADLAALLRENFGLRAVVYQASHYAWHRQYRDLQVVGIPCVDMRYQSISKSFLRTPPAALHIYSPAALACAGAHRPAIGISHGAYWDTKAQCLANNDDLRNNLLNGLKAVDQLVSVDANTLASLQAYRGLIAADDLEEIESKTSIILNYADSSFQSTSPRSFEFSETNPCRVLYARRLYAARGFDLVADAAPELLERCTHMQLSFCGAAEPEPYQQLLELMHRFPGRIDYQELLPEQMPHAYADQHLSLVPSVNSEGSSLSALESMASGCVVIATYTGGLGNIVVDGFNGTLIPPTVEALIAAIESLYHNPEHCKTLARHGQQVAEALNLQAWRQQWHARILELRDAPSLRQPLPITALPITARQPAIPAQRPATVSILHPLVEGIGLAEAAPGLLPRQRPQALFDLLEQLGLPTRFCAADRLLNSGERICSRTYTCYDDTSLIYIYKPLVYAFLIPGLKQQLPQIFADHASLIGRTFYGINTPDAAPWRLLQEQVDRIRVSNPVLWFDWLDAPELDWPETSEQRQYSQSEREVLRSYVNTIYEHFMRHASLFTTTCRQLQQQAEAWVQRRPLLIGNAAVSRYCLQKDLHRPTHTLRGPVWQPAPNSPLVPVLKNLAPYRWRVVYWGAADPRVLDFDLIAALASALPTVAFLLVGPGPWPSSLAAANVQKLPHVPQADLALLASHCQAAMIPFRKNVLTEAVDPLKLHEYLELSLPVVATATATLKDLQSDYAHPMPLHLCQGAEQWIQTLSQLLEPTAAGPSPRRLDNLGQGGRLWSEMAAPLLHQIQQSYPALKEVAERHPFVRLNPLGLRASLQTAGADGAENDGFHLRLLSSQHQQTCSTVHLELVRLAPGSAPPGVRHQWSSPASTHIPIEFTLPLYCEGSQTNQLSINASGDSCRVLSLQLLDDQQLPLQPELVHTQLGAHILRLDATTLRHGRCFTVHLLLEHSNPASGQPAATGPGHLRINATLLKGTA